MKSIGAFDALCITVPEKSAAVTVTADRIRRVRARASEIIMKLNISRTLALALVTMGALGGIACSGAANITPPENSGGAIGLSGAGVQEINIPISKFVLQAMIDGG